jgi:hypothetical protein
MTNHAEDLEKYLKREHDWEECPIEEVIVLKDTIEQYRE